MQLCIAHVSTPEVKKIHPFASVWYEVGVLWANITHIQSHAISLGYFLETDESDVSNEVL